MEQSVQSKGCEEFLALLDKHFRILFDEFGLEIIDVRDDRMGEHCLAILQSADCRLRFTSDKGFIEISLGPTTSPITWADDPDGRRVWFPIHGIAELVNEDYLIGAEELRTLGHSYASMSPPELMGALSARYGPVLNDMIALFQEDVFKERQGEIEKHFAR